MKYFTVDLEEWFHVRNLRFNIKREDWDKQESRIIKPTLKLLKLLKKHNTKATFFVLGYVAEKYPKLIKKIHEEGHEIACHGYNHKALTELSIEEISEDIDKSLKLIKKACGVKCRGYRATSFSITRKNLNVLDLLKKKGFSYDSSMFPIKRTDYGIKCPQKPFKSKDLIEFPMTTIFNIPIGGGYFRVLPYWITKFLISRKKYVMFYVHPWELDYGQPRIKMSFWRRFRQYYGLNKTKNKLDKLLRDFKFEPIGNKK